MSARAVVVGGGITGLSAAYDLARGGAEVSVVEASTRWGGKIRTDVVDGFLVESGPDSVVSYRPAALQLAAELGLGDQVVGTLDPRLVSVRLAGEMVPLPGHLGVVLPTRLRPFVTTRLLTPRQKLRAGLDLLLPRRLGPADIAVGELLRARLGDAVVDRLADPLFGGIYGTSVDELSLDAVLPSLREAERAHRSLMLASLRQGRTTAAGTGSPFRSLRRGMGGLVDALVEHLAAQPAVDLRLGQGAVGLSGGRTTSLVHLDDGSRLPADVVVLSTPGPRTARLVADELPAAAELVGSVRHASTAVVSLGFGHESFTTAVTGHGFLEAGPVKSAVSGCTFSSLKWPGRAPDGTVLLRAFVPDRSAHLLREDDRTVLDVVRRQIAGILGIRGAPVMRHLARWPAAMPVYSVGHPDRMSRLGEAMAERPRWLLAGATYTGVGVPDCVAAGRRAGAEALGLL